MHKPFQLKIIITLIITSVIIVFTSCQENAIEPVLYGKISGLVIDLETGLAVKDAGITTNPPSNSIVTDNAGKFSISDVPVGSYSITAQKSGYKKGTVSVSVREGVTSEANIFLEKDTGINSQPGSPEKPQPENGSENQPINLTLSWFAADSDSDTLLYDVFLYESNSSTQNKILENKSDTSVSVSDLKYGTTYFWQVIVKDSEYTVNGNVWSFKTGEFPNNRIAFASNRDGNFEIYSCDSLGNNVVRLTKNNSRDWWPKVSPKGNKIAFVSDVSVENHIYVMDKDGSDVTKVTNLPVAGYHNYGKGFCWTPDGGSVIYAHYDKLYKVDINGSNIELIANAPANRNFKECDISPLGDKIVVITTGVNIFDNEIYLMNSDGSGMEIFVDNLPGIIESPVFSIDGQRVLYTYDISGYENSTGRQLNARIFSKKTNGTDSIDLSKSKPSGMNDLYPRFSPDGSRIIFTTVKNDGSGESEIWSMNTNGENRKKIISSGLMADWK